MSSSNMSKKPPPLELPNGHTIKLGIGLESKQRDILTHTLVSNMDLFAWSATDLPGVDPHVASHKLSIYKEARYVSQKKRKLGEERRLAAKAEADKLLNTGFIEEAHYTIGSLTWSWSRKPMASGRCVLITRILTKLVLGMPIPYPILTDLSTT